MRRDEVSSKYFVARAPPVFCFAKSTPPPGGRLWTGCRGRQPLPRWLRIFFVGAIQESPAKRTAHGRPSVAYGDTFPHRGRLALPLPMGEVSRSDGEGKRRGGYQPPEKRTVEDAGSYGLVATSISSAREMLGDLPRVGRGSQAGRAHYAFVFLRDLSERLDSKGGLCYTK